MNITHNKPMLSKKHSFLWRQSSICVNKIRQPPVNIRLRHVIKLILNKCNKIWTHYKSQNIDEHLESHKEYVDEDEEIFKNEIETILEDIKTTHY